MSAAAGEDGWHGSQQQAQVEPDAPAPDVAGLEPHDLVEVADRVAAANLPRAGDAGLHVEAGVIVCTRHGYRFDLKTGDCLTVGGYGVPVFPVEIVGDTVYVSVWEYD